jgi:hypothetical protein
MAQNNSGTLNTNTGSKMSNAKFSQAYLYNASTTASWGTAQTNNAYRQAPTTGKLATVTLNAYQKWYSDDVTIWFNVP